MEAVFGHHGRGCHHVGAGFEAVDHPALFDLQLDVGAEDADVGLRPVRKTEDADVDGPRGGGLFAPGSTGASFVVVAAGPSGSRVATAPTFTYRVVVIRVARVAARQGTRDQEDDWE